MTQKEISNPLAIGTRVTWNTNPRETRSGVIEGYVYADMPYKLYQIRETETGRVSFVHPDHIVRTYGEPHTVIALAHHLSPI